MSGGRSTLTWSVSLGVTDKLIALAIDKFVITREIGHGYISRRNIPLPRLENMECEARIIDVSHNNFFVATQKFSSPGLATRTSVLATLRLHKSTKPPAGEVFVSFCDPTGNRTPIYTVKGCCPNR